MNRWTKERKEIKVACDIEYWFRCLSFSWVKIRETDGISVNSAQIKDWYDVLLLLKFKSIIESTWRPRSRHLPYLFNRECNWNLDNGLVIVKDIYRQKFSDSDFYNPSNACTVEPIEFTFWFDCGYGLQPEYLQVSESN